MTGHTIRVEVRGIDLEVSEEGDPDAPRTVLWTHGLTSSRASERAAGLLGPPVGEGLRTIRYDSRGHGESGIDGEPADFTWPGIATDLFALADALGIDRFVSAGASMGAAASLHAAVRDPHRIEAIVLVIPPTAWATREAQRTAYRDGVELLERSGMDAYIDRSSSFPPHPVEAEAGPELIEARRAVQRRADPVGIARALRGAIDSDLPGEDELARLAVPTLIFAWRGDPIHPVATSQRLVELIPGATLHIAGTLAEVQSWPTLMGEWLAQRIPKG